MFIRTWLNIIFLMAVAYGSCQVMFGKLYATSSWQYYFHLICPWALLFGSLKAWHQSLIWRRMMEQKNTAPHLSRGQHQASRSNNRTTVLERISQLLFLLSIAAICKQLEIQNTPWIMGGALGSYFMLRLAIGKVR